MSIRDFANAGDFQSKKIFDLSALAPADALDDKVYVAEMPASFLPDAFIVNANYRHYIHDFSAENVKKFLSTPLKAEDCDLVLIPNTGVYPPLTYFPQAVAAFI